MPRVKSIIKRCEVEVAKQKRTCKNTGRAISRGSKCLVVYDDPYRKYNYSREAAIRMIRRARQQLAELEDGLGD